MDATAVEVAVRSLLHDPEARVVARREEGVDWRVVSERTDGLRRLTGTARSKGEEKPWSLIVKTARPEAPGDADWKREVLAYTSGVLHDTPHVRTPNLLHVSEPAEDRISLWLEDVPDDAAELWPLERHVLTARHLGEWNAAHELSGEPPAWLWRDWLAGLDSRPVDVSGFLRAPLVSEMFEDLEADLERVSVSFEAHAERLARLPPFLAHLDPGRFNLRAQGERTVVLDFQSLGVGPLGTDLAMAHFLDLCRFYADPDEAAELSAAGFEAYLTGSGGKREDVRFVYRAVASMRAAIVVRLLLPELAAGKFGRFTSWGKKRGLEGRDAALAWGRGMGLLLSLGESGLRFSRHDGAGSPR